MIYKDGMNNITHKVTDNEQRIINILKKHSNNHKILMVRNDLFVCLECTRKLARLIK